MQKQFQIDKLTTQKIVFAYQKLDPDDMHL